MPICPYIKFLLLFLLPLYIHSITPLDENNSKKINQILTSLKNLHSIPIPKFTNKTNPNISIVIPVKNSNKNLKTLINSIQYQTLKNLEIVLILDDFKNFEKNFLEEIEDLQKSDSRITIIKNDFSRGKLYSRIHGALESRGDYISFFDPDDIFFNYQILESILEDIKNGKKIDIIAFDYFTGEFNILNNEYNTKILYTGSNKDLYNKILVQPKIKKYFFYKKKISKNSENKENEQNNENSENEQIEKLNDDDNIIRYKIFDKIFSRKLILKIAEDINEIFWNRNISYFDDFLINFSAAKNAESYIIKSLAGVWHCTNIENTDLKNEKFILDGNKLIYPENTIKKIDDFLSVIEKILEMTEDDKKAEFFRLRILKFIGESEKISVISHSYHFERFVNICRKALEFKYNSKEIKEEIGSICREIFEYDISMKNKYSDFLDNKYEDNNIKNINNEEKNDL